VFGLSHTVTRKLSGVFVQVGTPLGNSQLSATAIDADFTMISDLGIVKSFFNMKSIDFIDKASYSGNVVLENFDLGTFFRSERSGENFNEHRCRGQRVY
jgi:hypothetical protein